MDGAIWSAVTLSVTSNVSPKAMPCGITSKVAEACAQGASDAAIVAGRGVDATVSGCVAEVAATTRTLVSGVVPLFSRRTVSRAVSQLSRMPSLSPPITWMGSAESVRTFGPATGVTCAQLLIRPKQDELDPMGRTE